MVLNGEMGKNITYIITIVDISGRIPHFFKQLKPLHCSNHSHSHTLLGKNFSKFDFQ